eukprot:3470795-Alexandrium_andersonii.AAC.1
MAPSVARLGAPSGPPASGLRGGALLLDAAHRGGAIAWRGWARSAPRSWAPSHLPGPRPDGPRWCLGQAA